MGCDGNVSDRGKPDDEVKQDFLRFIKRIKELDGDKSEGEVIRKIFRCEQHRKKSFKQEDHE